MSSQTIKRTTFLPSRTFSSYILTIGFPCATFVCRSDANDTTIQSFPCKVEQWERFPPIRKVWKFQTLTTCQRLMRRNFPLLMREGLDILRKTLTRFSWDSLHGQGKTPAFASLNTSAMFSRNLAEMVRKVRWNIASEPSSVIGSGWCGGSKWKTPRSLVPFIPLWKTVSSTRCQAGRNSRNSQSLTNGGSKMNRYSGSLGSALLFLALLFFILSHLAKIVR